MTSRPIAVAMALCFSYQSITATSRPAMVLPVATTEKMAASGPCSRSAGCCPVNR